MTWKECVLFLDHKRRLIAPFVRPDTAINYEMMFSHVISKMEHATEGIPDAALLDFDKSLERSIVEEILEEDEAAVRLELRTKYGFTSLKEEPTKVLRRIERTRKISNDEEAELVDRYLSGSYLGWEMSDSRRERFGKIAREYFQRSHSA